MTQKEMVLNALREHGPLSHRDLNNITGLPACSKRISELREDGWDIPDEDYPGHDYGRYVLMGKKCENAQSVEKEKKFSPMLGVSPASTSPQLFTEQKTEKNCGEETGCLCGLSGIQKPSQAKESLKWYGYKCKKGHIDHWYGSDPPKMIMCAGCNYQMYGSLISGVDMKNKKIKGKLLYKKNGWRIYEPSKSAEESLNKAIKRLKYGKYGTIQL